MSAKKIDFDEVTLYFSNVWFILQLQYMSRWISSQERENKLGEEVP